VTQPPYNVNPNATSGDNSSALQAANDALERTGGGVLYLPNGNYYLRNLRLGTGVIIEGQDEYKTKVYCIGDGNGNLIDSKTGDARNAIVVHPPSGLAVSQESRGIFTRGDAYIANNTVSGAGRTAGVAEGETLSWESGGWEGNFNWGTTLSATPTTMTVTPHTTLVTPTITYGELCVWITDGRGLGQLRKVVSISGNTITVDTPFAVTPDDTSKWTLVTPNKHITAYNNIGTDNIIGILPFGIAYDTVIADNVLTNTDGITVWAINQQGIVDMPSYFTRINGNTITGISRAALSNHIGLIGARQAPNYFDIMVYGTEIVDNILSDNAAISPRTKPTTTGGVYPGIFLQSYGGGPSKYPDRRHHKHNCRGQSIGKSANRRHLDAIFLRNGCEQQSL
jgi:hypothetical protein